MQDLSFITGTIMDVLTNPVLLLYVWMGTFMGLVFGSLPGLTATMAVALLIPLTYSMDATTALGIMLGAYVGGIGGGAVSAILLNIPGTPAAVCTTFDGHPMAQQGRAAEALGWAAFASFFGGLFSWIILVLAAPALARIATSFSSPEYAAISFFGLAIIASVSGKSLVKGIISGLFGMILAFIGLDPIWGEMRFNFGVIDLMSGVSLMPALIGFYSIPQILTNCTQKNTVGNIKVKIRVKDFVPSPRKIWKSIGNLVRTSIIGTIVGTIPATGGNVAAFISYDMTKRFSKDPDSFGKGNHDGVIASEAANNAVTGGALIPMLTLGIPGDSVTAVLFGGLLIHGLTPGPGLFVDNYGVVIGMFTTLLVGTVAMYILQLVGIKVFVKILSVPVDFLSAILVALSLVGSFALRGNIFDVAITVVLGLFGYLMMRGKFPVAPAVLGLVLGGMFEREFRLSLRMSGGDPSIFLSRPVSAIIILASFAMIAQSVWKRHKNKGEVEDENLI